MDDSDEETPSASEEGSAEMLEALVRGNTTFGLELYRELRAGRSSENLFFSPHNLSAVLAMVYAGAKGETREQLEKGLHLPKQASNIHPLFERLDAKLSLETRGGRPEGSGEGEGTSDEDGDEAENVMRTANGVWTQEDLTLEEPFLETLTRHYGAGLHRADFRGDPERARTDINEWAEQKTEGKIADLIPEGAIEQRTRLVLTAAIYFRGRWQVPFSEDATREAEFDRLSGETSTVEMMYKKGRDLFRFARGESHVAVELPYGEGTYSMVVILPDAGSFAQVEKEVDASFLRSVFEGLEERPVELQLPKFEMSSRFSAREQLASLGIEKPFERSADFSGMTTETSLRVDDILHKAYVSVDEKGTEAAAASAATMRTTSLRPERREFEKVTVDRPFLFAIRHRGTEAVLFVGRVVDP